MKKATTLILDEDAIEKLRRLAYLRNASKSEVVRQIMEDYFKLKAEELKQI